MKKIILALMALIGLAGATTAFADDDGWYVLGAVGRPTGSDYQSRVDNALIAAGGTGFSSSFSKATVYKLQLGYQINKNFAVEGGYLGSSNQTYSATGGNLGGTLTVSGNVSGYNLIAVGILPLANQFSLLGKLGVAGLQESVTATGGGFTVSVNGSKTDLTYGLGAKYDFTKEISMRLDLDSYNVGNSTSASRSNVWMVGAGYKF